MKKYWILFDSACYSNLLNLNNLLNDVHNYSAFLITGIADTATRHFLWLILVLFSTEYQLTDFLAVIASTYLYSLWVYTFDMLMGMNDRCS